MERSATPSPGPKSHLPNKPLPSPYVKQNVIAPASRSFTQRKAQLSRASRPNIVEGNNVMRSIERPPPGDIMSRRRSQSQLGLAKRRSTYYENEFAAGREMDPTRDRVRNEAIVMAELRTNVILQDEFTFITDLSYHLSNRYQRSMSSIVINLQHGCCMMFGGSFDPAYTLTIFALPSLIQPTTNKRNAALIQAQIQECLGVAPSRGYVRFVATPEEDVASGGKTVAGEMDELDRSAKADVEQGRELKPRKSRRLSVRSFASLRPSTPGNKVPQPLPTPPVSTDETLGIPMIATAIPEHPPTPPLEPPIEEKSTKTATRRKSFVTALFGGKASSKERRPKTSSGQPP